MNLSNILMVIAALVPAVVLGVYVFLKDRVEKEPFGLLALLFGCGIVICFPVVEVSSFFEGVINSIFTPFTTYVDGTYVLSSPTFEFYNAIKYLIAVALVEEGFKWLALFLVTRKSKHFNSLFDGVIYAVFVSLGFAAFENVLYAFSYGWDTVLMRAFTAVPGHVFDAILMGYYYSLWHVYDKARSQERELKRRGLIQSGVKEFSPVKYLVLSIVVPVLAHGFYDFCCTVGTEFWVIVFYAFLIFLYVFCFKRVRKMSKMDAKDTTYSSAMVLKKHPYLVSIINEMIPQGQQVNTAAPAFVKPAGVPRTATVADIIDEYSKLKAEVGSAAPYSYTGQTEFTKK